MCTNQALAEVVVKGVTMFTGGEEHFLLTKRIKWKTYQRVCSFDQDFKFHSIRRGMVGSLAQLPMRLAIQYERAF